VFNCYRERSKGGGIKTFVLNNLPTNLISKYSIVTNSYETLFLDIDIGKRESLRFGTVYRVPSSSLQEFNVNFFESFETCLSVKHSVVVGDMNANLFNPLKSRHIYDFANNFLCRDFMIQIHNPTRISPENSITKYSLIDHIWVKYPKVNLSSVLNCEIADHLPTVAFLDIGNPQCKYKSNIKIDKRIYDAPNVQQFKTEIENFVNNINYAGDVSSLVDYFITNIYDIHNLCFPIKKISINKIKPWISHDLKVCIKKKGKMLESYRKVDVLDGIIEIIATC
jgi:hypothetical protein